MCGIVACSTTPQNNCRHNFIELCQQSLIRGVHAFGIAYEEDGGVVVKKSLCFDDIVANIPDPLPLRIMFHNRYATSGDASRMENNQPLYEAGCALIVNGIVDMGTKMEMERKWNVKMNTENDGELVLQDAIHGSPFKKLHLPQSALAGVFLSSKDFYAIRNTRRPLWHIPTQQASWVVSTKDIARRAGLDISHARLVSPFKALHIG